jgi:hypothetical protein
MAVEGIVQETPKQMAWVKSVKEHKISEGVVSAKMSLTLWTGSKNISVDGNINLKRNELMQVTLSILGFVELGRLEFTPEYALVINRTGREYAKVTYDQIPYLKNAGIDFYSLQALFWNEVFVPGQGATWEEDDFVLSESGQHILLSLRNEGFLQCLFRLHADDFKLLCTQVNLSNKITTPRFSCVYEHFTEIDSKIFPDRMRWEVLDGRSSYVASFLLTNIRHNVKDIRPSDLPGGKYKAIDISGILKQMLK